MFLREIEKASSGIKEVGNLLTEMGVNLGSTEFSAKLPQAEQDKKVEDLIKEGYAINFVQFTPKTVTPEGISEKEDARTHVFIRLCVSIKTCKRLVIQSKKNVIEFL